MRKVSHLKKRLAKVKKANALKDISFKVRDITQFISLNDILEMLKHKYISKRKGIFATKTSLKHFSDDLIILEVLALSGDTIDVHIKYDKENHIVIVEYKNHKNGFYKTIPFVAHKDSILENLEDIMMFLTKTYNEDQNLNL